MTAHSLDPLAHATRGRDALGVHDTRGGWLVRGVFTEVNKGNQLRRAAIGFGAGETNLQVIVAGDNLAGSAPRPFSSRT
jgi:hypothetical protein